MNAPITPPAVAISPAVVHAQLLTVATACPLATDNPADCVLHELRRLRPTQAVAWLAGLSADEQEFLLRYHECCLAVKLEHALFDERYEPVGQSPRPAVRTRRRSAAARARLSEIRHCTTEPALSR